MGVPKTEDGKIIVVINPSTEGFKTWLCGRGDDPAPTPPASGRGTGQQFRVNFTTGEVGTEKTTEWQWTEPVEVHDGQFNWDPVENWGHDDEFDVSVRFPATPATPTPGTGNVNEVPTGMGFSVYVPAAGDGSHTIDLSAAVPVDADGEGFWNVDPNTGAVTPSENPGQAIWHLMDAEVIAYLVRSISMGNTIGLFDVDVYKTEFIHQNWRMRLTVRKTTAGAGTASGWLLCFRRSLT